MFKSSWRVSSNKLEQALEECQLANKQGYTEAQVYLKDLKKSIDDASDIIFDCISDMKKYHITDESLIQNIKMQLQTVQTEFEQSYFDTKTNLDNKSRMSSKFNITLFGRTKAGKSTLMEILTHGDGSHMGKGGQRTTRDVRSYDWKGMSVTDVPGIDAYEGQEDDQKAEEAAIFADLILFLITAGQPEGTEADWLVKLKRMDKPVLCICNYKQSMGEGIDDFRLKRLLDNPEKLEERMNIDELVKQFNSFLNDQLPNEHVDFLVSHLLAKFSSQQPEYASKRKELEKISRFSAIEHSIIDEVHTNGVLHRKKCYLSIIDAPLYQQMNQLFAFSSNAYSQFLIIQDKITAFKEWCENFNSNQKRSIENNINREYNKLRNSVPGFVEAHLEDDDVNSSWKEHCEQFDIQHNIENIVQHSSDILREKIADMFSELEKEMKFSLEWNFDNKLGNYQFINWKKGTKWAGAIGSAGLGIAALILSSNPLGWAALGVGAVFSFFAWLLDSREDKLRERRTKLTEKLNKGIKAAETNSLKEVFSWYNKNICKQEFKITNRLNIIGKSLLSLSCGERQLALGYGRNHKNISKMIIANIFHALDVPMTEFDRIKCVARVPGRRIAIVIEGKESLPLKISKLASKLGNKEAINVIRWGAFKDFNAQILFLLRYFGIRVKPLIKQVNDGKQTVVYLYNKNFNQEQIDSIDLIQQILNVHIILK